jgi:hypothetical protein
MELSPLAVWVTVAALVVILVVGAARSSHRRRARGRDITLSVAQAAAMRVLWEHRLSAPPAPDPLEGLSEAELADLIRICSADYARELGDTTNLRRLLEQGCKRRGFSDRQTAVLIGMAVNGVGRPAIAGPPLTSLKLDTPHIGGRASTG